MRTVLVLAIALALFCAVMAVITGRAVAHDAPTGWSYPILCCSQRDCKQAASAEVKETRFGYLIASTGETVRYGDRRIKDSPDGLFHTCRQAGDFDNGRVICLFVPTPAY